MSIGGIPTPTPTPPTGQPDPSTLPVSPEVTNQVPNAPATTQVEKWINNPGESLASFINDAHSAGYQHIDPNIITSIGQQMGNTNNAKLALAQIKQSLAIPNKQTQALFEPSAVAPDQTPAKVISDHQTNTGNAPISIATIKGMQQTLIDANYNGQSYVPAGSKVDGIWNSDWANAAHQYQLASHTQPGFGNTGARSLFSTIFNPGFMSYAIPFVSSIIKNIPGDALKALGGGLKITTDAVNAFDNFVAGNGAAGKSQSVHIANWLNNMGQKTENQGTMTDAQYAKQSNWEHALAIGNTALTFSGLGKAAEEVALTAKGGIAAGKAAGATNAASALLTKVEPMAPKGPLNWVMNTVLPDTQDGSRFAFTNWLKNSPTATRIAPQLTAQANAGLDATATEVKNAYKTARRIAATPYARPVTAIAGQLGSSVSTAGLKFGIQGHADNWMGDPNAPVATELNSLKPIAGLTGLGLNLAQIAMHGDLGSVPALSESTGNIFAQARSGVATMLNRNGLLPDWERGTGASAKTVIKSFVKAGLTPDDFYAHIADQADQFAAQHAAQPLVDAAIQNKSLDVNNHDAVHNFQLEKQGQIRADEGAMEQARASYIQKPGLFAKDLANSMLEHRESTLKKYSGDLVSLAKTRRLTASDVIPHLDNLGIPKAPAEDTSWMNQGLNGAPTQRASGKLGIMRYGLQTAEDAQSKAMEFAQELQKAKPGYVAPTTVDGLKASSDGTNFGALDKPFQMPKTHLSSSVTPEESALHDQVINYLGSELGRNTKDLDYVPTQDLIKLIVEKSDLLAHDVKLPDNAPQSLIDAFAKTKELGYKHVWGTDIGHFFNQAPVDLETLGTQQNWASNLLDKWGINFTPMSDETSVSAISAKNGLNDVIDAKKAEDPTKIPIWGNGNRLVDFAQSMIKHEPSLAQKAAIKTASSRAGKILSFKGLSLAKGGTWGDELNALIKQKTVTDETGNIVDVSNMTNAKNYLVQALTGDTNPQSWTRGEFMNAMMAKGDENGLIENKFGHEVEAVGMSQKDASDLWYGMKKGLRNAPAYQGGYNVLSKLMNSTLGLDNIPLQIKGQRIFDITGPIQNALIQARYLFSPRQAYLRVVKSALKGVNEDMPYSMNARASLEELSQEAQDTAKALTEKVYGKNESALDLSDFSTKEFASKDFFNIFDPQAILERTVHYVSKNMESEGKVVNSPAGLGELKNRVDSINNYGERTAAEKTLNGFFFPFSFEKTVVRELGGHLLDNPSTRLMVAGAIHLYNSTEGQKMDKWLKDNVPLWKEVEKFNPFFHGTGLGQFGGINRTPEGIIGQSLYGGASVPDFSKVSDADKVKLFIHMMQPKPVTSQASLKAAMNLVPAIRDLNNLFVGLPLSTNAPFAKTAGGAVRASVQDLAGQALRAVHHLVQAPKAFESQGYQPYALQQTNAWLLRNKYIAGLTTALQTNASGGNVTFLPETPAVGGQKVSRTNINKLVAQIYPAWNPNLQTYALARETAVTAERVNIQNELKKVGPNLLSMYDNFTKGSDSVQSQIQKASLDPTFDYSKVTTNMATLRYWASWLAAKDPNFTAFYSKYYASKYGPLKGL